jgi:hypothetical protein
VGKVSNEKDTCSISGALPSQAQFAVGYDVEYFSASWGNRWIPAVVRGFEQGKYVLDVNPSADPSKVRAASKAQFAVGCDVEYFSASYGNRWIPAVVRGFEQGNYVLDVNPSADPSKVRAASKVSLQSTFQLKLQHSWVDFEPEEAAILLQAYNAGRESVEFEVRGQAYVADFKSMEQRNVKSGRLRTIRVLDFTD